MLSDYYNQPKRLNGNASNKKIYNKVQPFDSKSLQKLIANRAINGEDFKFISWQDFDIALESDTLLFEKLASLSNSENNFLSNAETNFIPFANANSISNDYFYRVNRNEGNNDINKEKISYQE